MALGFLFNFNSVFVLQQHENFILWKQDNKYKKGGLKGVRYHWLEFLMVLPKYLILLISVVIPILSRETWQFLEVD